MRRLSTLYRYINILSVDVAVGAVLSALFFSHLFLVSILPYGYIALALTVWIIYTADHLRDASKIKGIASSARHRFHQKHFRALIFCLVIALIVDATVILFIRKQVLFSGMILFSFVILYLLFHSSAYFLKEIAVALIYTAGVLLPSISVTSRQLTFVDFSCIAQFYCIALLNLLIFSWFDVENDSRDHMRSFATHFGKGKTSNIITLILIVAFTISVYQISKEGFRQEFLILFVMQVILLLTFVFHSFFRRNDLYRIAGDAVFYCGVLILL